MRWPPSRYTEKRGQDEIQWQQRRECWIGKGQWAATLLVGHLDEDFACGALRHDALVGGKNALLVEFMDGVDLDLNCAVDGPLGKV